MNYTNYHIGAKQVATSVKIPGALFYEATRFNITIGANATLIISSQPNGRGNIIVDDILRVTMTDRREPNNKAVYEHDFSNNCTVPIRAIRPINLTNNSDFRKFRGRSVDCKIQLLDKCGGGIYGSDFYLCVGE